MARIPDATQLGERIQPRTGGQPYISRGAEVAAAGMADSAAAIGRAAQQFQQQDDAFNFARARSALLTAEAGVRKQLETDPDWQNHEQTYNNVMKAAREEGGKLIRGGRSRALFDQEAEADILRGVEGVRRNARVKETEWARGELDNVLESNRRAALESQDTAQRDQLVLGSLDAITGARDKGYISPDDAVNLRQNWAQRYGEGFVEVQPTDAAKLKLLRNPKNNPAQYIDPAKRAQMIEHLEDKLRVVSDRREARAERAYAQAERQIASGVPATPKMWADWRADIAGTSVEKDFGGLLDGEKEVQEVLRKPIGEQLRLVQEKDAALKSTGGTIAQAANVERLRNAVKQNVALLENNPLLFAEQRMEAKTAPLDLQGSEAELSSALQERAVQLQTLSKRFGTQVPMRPLLPQEAAQLSAILDGASPAQATELFGSLRNSAGDSEVFRGMMQQIAPDSPVKAMAGMLAADQRDLTTGTHWFSPDDSVVSQNVAATMLQGERLLNPTKGDKAEDGKPQSKNLYLPDPAALQTEFADVVGDVFAGRPKAADAAMQAVRAYYVGKSAQTGRIASDRTDIDTDLVREAVKATLGNVVDYNGNGNVLAPWGMTESDFESKAERAFAAKAAELKLPKLLTPEAAYFGLANAGADGQYAVTVGRNLLRDANNNPIIIDIKPSSARDKRGFIDRSNQ